MGTAIKTVLITGVSTGIGYELSRLYLEKGYLVCGVSRRPPEQLVNHPNMVFAACDLQRLGEIEEVVTAMLNRVDHAPIETVVLNAGKFGAPPQRADETSIEHFQDVLSVNLLAVKAVLDACLKRVARPECVVFSSSISAIRQRAGMLSYAVSKAALNALARVYQIENPDVFFATLGLCNVDTHLANTILQADERFDELNALRMRALQPGYLVSARDRARHIFSVLDQRDRLNLKSGEFREIRELIPMLS
jgi:NAD(P)-dependent dehydrogenase (short-subunit alcohol dehydrogenase family)